MISLPIFFGILGELLAGAISPGPSFVLVCRSAMLYSRKAGLAAALGMGIGGMIFGCLTLIGLSSLLKQVPSVYVLLQICGGLYLLYLAYIIWRGAAEPLVISSADDSDERRPLKKVFLLSLMTQLSNPKTAVVYGSIFTVFLPPAPPSSLLIALVPGIFLVEFLWYAVVAVLFSVRAPREIYLRSKTTTDRVVAIILGLLGSRLLFGRLVYV